MAVANDARILDEKIISKKNSNLDKKSHLGFNSGLVSILANAFTSVPVLQSGVPQNHKYLTMSP